MPFVSYFKGKTKSNVQQSQLSRLNAGLGPGNEALFKPRPANIAQPLVQYATAHLLGAPQEVRDRIYHLIEQDTMRKDRSDLGQHPNCHYQNLGLVCRQLYLETQAALPLFIVPRNKIEAFLNKSIIKHSTWENFRALSIELPHNVDPEVFTRCAHAMKQLALILEDVRIFGVGSDAIGEPTSSQSMACGRFDNSLLPQMKKLSIGGQKWKVKLDLLYALTSLLNLKTLVLDNLNAPLLVAHVLKNKPCLKALFISADHRSTLHADYRNDPSLHQMIGSLTMPVTQHVPLRDLNVAFNSSFRIVSMIALTSQTLESLTLVVPDQSKQSAGHSTSLWLVELAEILSLLPSVPKLRVLRLCLHTAIYDNGYEFDSFIGAFKFYVPRLLALQSIELHCNIRTSWAADEFFSAFPKNLEKAYLSDLFVNQNEKALLRMISERTRIGTDGGDITSHTLIGEDLSRCDFIAFSHKLLSFVSYDYHVEQEHLRAKVQGKSIMSLIKMNGLLLDRRRNQHLAARGGQNIPWYNKTPGTKFVDDELAQNTAKLEKMNAPMFDEVPEQHVFATNDEYFGNEVEAEKIFHQEGVRLVDNPEPVSYPVVVDIPNEFKHSTHWMSC